MRRLVKLFLFLVIIIGIGGVTYQVYSNSKHPNKLHQINKNKPISIVALGDSLTQGVGDPKKEGGYVSRTKQSLEKKGYKNVNIVNYGIAGQRSDQIDKRVEKNVNGLSSKIERSNLIILTVGGNDLLQSLQNNALVESKTKFNRNMVKASFTYRYRLKHLIKEIRQRNKKAPIYVFGIYNPVYVYFANVSVINEYVRKFNKITYSVMLSDKRLHFIDISALSYGQYRTEKQRKNLIKSSNDISGNPLDILKLNETKGELNNYISTADHFHPNDKGYDFMTDKLVSKLIKFNDWD